MAIPLVVRTHPAHRAVSKALEGRLPHLTAHSEVETYSVLTRLPSDARAAPDDAMRVLTQGFGPLLAIDARKEAGILARLAAAGIAGGAVYDALVALAAVDADLPLVTRDVRALPTYARLGARVEIIT